MLTLVTIIGTVLIIKLINVFFYEILEGMPTEPDYDKNYDKIKRRMSTW